MKKPLMRRAAALDWAAASICTIYFYATPTIAQEMGEFGSLADGPHHDHYQLIVDPRYDFDEVLDYLKLLIAAES